MKRMENIANEIISCICKTKLIMSLYDSYVVSIATRTLMLAEAEQSFVLPARITNRDKRE